MGLWVKEKNAAASLQKNTRPVFLFQSLHNTEKLSFFLHFPGNWTNGRFEDEGTIVTPNYSYSGTFSGEEPVGPGRFHFDTGCEQEGEYVTKRIVRRTSTMREVVHVPVWRCLMLYDAGPRKTTLNS